MLCRRNFCLRTWVSDWRGLKLLVTFLLIKTLLIKKQIDFNQLLGKDQGNSDEFLFCEIQETWLLKSSFRWRSVRKLSESKHERQLYGSGRKILHAKLISNKDDGECGYNSVFNEMKTSLKWKEESRKKSLRKTSNHNPFESILHFLFYFSKQIYATPQGLRGVNASPFIQYYMIRHHSYLFVEST